MISMEISENKQGSSCPEDAYLKAAPTEEGAVDDEMSNERAAEDRWRHRGDRRGGNGTGCLRSGHGGLGC